MSTFTSAHQHKTVNEADKELKEFEKQYIKPKRMSQVRTGSFAAVMEQERQAESEAEYLKLHDMFPEEQAMGGEEIFFEQNFGNEDDEEEEENGLKEQEGEKPKRRGTITKLISFATKQPQQQQNRDRATSSGQQHIALASGTPPPANLPPTPTSAAVPKKRGSIFQRIAGNSAA